MTSLPRAPWMTAGLVAALLVLCLCSDAPAATTATWSAGGVTVSGTVAGGRPSWTVRLQQRVLRQTAKGPRAAWARVADSPPIGAARSFTLRFTPSGQTAVVRILVLSGSRVVRRGAAARVSAPAGATTGPQAPAGTPPNGAPTTPSPSPAPVAAPTPSKLGPGDALAPGQRLQSPGGRYALVMQASDGNLVLYDRSAALWSTGPAGAGARAIMQSDGNLVVYNGGTAKWNSHTDGFTGAELDLQDDGNLVVYRDHLPIWDWSAGYLGHTLFSGATLRAGDFLRSADARYTLIMQGDGNLVLYDHGSALWSSGVAGAGATAAMQADGNLVVYTASGAASWNAGTFGFPGSSLELQTDGNLVIYHDGRAIWDWGTGYLGDTLDPGWSLAPNEYLLSRDHRFELIEQGSDGNLVLYNGGSPLWWMPGTLGHPGAQAIMQADGNFVVYSGGTAVANTGTQGHGGAYLLLQNDANVVVYLSSTALWSRITGPIGGASGGGADPGDDYPARWRNAAQDSLVDDWGEYNRECTSFVAWALSSRNGFTMPFHDNASGWGPKAAARGYAVNGTPALGAVAWSGAGDHVAYVQAINGSSVFIEEYNYGYNGTYHSRWVPVGSFQYIHFKDR